MNATQSTQAPIDVFIQEQRYHGRSDRTLGSYRRVLEGFRAWLGSNAEAASLDAATRQECMQWVHSMRGTYKSSTIATYASYVNRFYEYMTDVGHLERNPMRVVLEQMDESIETDPVRRDLGIDDMRSYVDDLQHPLTRAIVVTFLKTGIRVGELCNLDLRDLSLENVPLDADAPPTRGALSGRANAIYVSAAPAQGTEINGEVRSASNKRERNTVIPVDDELRRALMSWLAIRPDARSSANPLFINTKSSWGARLEPNHVRSLIRETTKLRGWHVDGGDRSENVTPHYFRHFFTTVLRDRIGDRGIVKYLRGDVADDVIDTYTHQWGDRVRSRYLDHIYSLNF